MMLLIQFFTSNAIRIFTARKYPAIDVLKARCPYCNSRLKSVEYGAPSCLDCGYVPTAITTELCKRLTKRESLETTRFYHDPVEGWGG
jgi:hypothetical protein